MSATEHLGAIILAGGRSRRLGRDKTGLRIGGKTMLERTVGLLAGMCSEVIVVTATPLAQVPPTARNVTDVYPGTGVLGGIFSGLVAGSCKHYLTVAADMPFLSPALLTYLASLAPGYDVVAPLVDGRAEPLHAVYGRACLPFMERRLTAGEAARIISFYDDVRVRWAGEEELRRLDPDLLSLFNINTPSDLERARSLLAAQGLALDE